MILKTLKPPNKAITCSKSPNSFGNSVKNLLNKSDPSNKNSISSISNDNIEYNDLTSISNEFNRFFSASPNSQFHFNDSLKKIDLTFLDMKQRHYLITTENTFSFKTSAFSGT